MMILETPYCVMNSRITGGVGSRGSFNTHQSNGVFVGHSVVFNNCLITKHVLAAGMFYKHKSERPGLESSWLNFPRNRL